MLGGPADSVSSRLVEQANIRAGLKRRHLLFGTISTFQAARMAVPSHRFRCLREIHVPAQWCCFACSSFGWCTGWSCFLPCLLLGGAAWPPPSLGRGALPPQHDGLGVWLLGCWAVRSSVGVVGFGVGVWLLSVGWGVGWGVLESFLVWAQITMKTTLKSDQHCELDDSVNYLKVERILLFFC